MDEYMFIISLYHMGIAVLLLGGEVIDYKIGAGWTGKKFYHALFFPGFRLVSPQSHPFTSFLLAYDGMVYKPKKFKGGGLLQYQPFAKDHQVEGLGPE